MVQVLDVGRALEKPVDIDQEDRAVPERAVRESSSAVVATGRVRVTCWHRVTLPSTDGAPRADPCPAISNTKAENVGGPGAHEGSPIARAAERGAHRGFGSSLVDEGSFLRNPCVCRIFPKSSTGCARRRPHPGPFAARRHVLCSVCARTNRRATRCDRRAEPPAVVRRGAPRPAPRAGHPGRLHRRRPLQHPRGQRAAGQPRPAPRGAGPAHPLQLPARDRFGRAEAEGLHPRRDRPPWRRRHAGGPLPLPD